jgi:restriction endonuclease S subunit
LQSVFACSDGWEEKKLGDKNIFEIIDGDRGKNYPTKKEFLEEGFCLFMNTKNVRPHGFNFETTIFISEEKDKILGNGKLRRNDVVMTTRGTIGNLGIYGDDVSYNNIRINSGMLIFRPNLKAIIPKYLFEVLRSGLVKAQIKKYVSGAAQPQLPIKTLVNFSFPVPKSLPDQRRIVAKLDALSAETKKLEDVYRRKLESLEELKKSILQKAFSGEL